MLTLITGTPGAGKTLYAVWKIARLVPGTTVEKDGQPIPRRLLSNVRELQVEHTHINAEDLNTWHTWAQPGDVILFDEVQEVWRPRGLGTKVPDCIAALETHRHMGVDIVLVTQHPMLVDPNIRRLVNRHIHLRRLAGKVAQAYEWDHCSNVNQTTTTVDSGLFWHPSAGYRLYKSAQVHTKPTTKVPKIAYVGLAALAFLAYRHAPDAWAKYGPGQAQADKPKVTSSTTVVTQGPPPGMVLPGQPKPMEPVVAAADMPTPPKPVLDGCAAVKDRCTCFTMKGEKVDPDPEICERLQADIPQVGEIGRLRSEITGFVPVPVPGGMRW